MFPSKENLKTVYKDLNGNIVREVKGSLVAGRIGEVIQINKTEFEIVYFSTNNTKGSLDYTRNFTVLNLENKMKITGEVN